MGPQLNLSNFVNAYYEYRDLQSCGAGRKLLIVGSGQDSTRSCPRSVSLLALQERVPASGAIHISDCADDLHLVFEPGREIIGHRNVDDLIDKLTYFLENEAEREAIAREVIAGPCVTIVSEPWRAWRGNGYGRG